jgi:hypothetical protein
VWNQNQNQSFVREIEEGRVERELTLGFGQRLSFTLACQPCKTKGCVTLPFTLKSTLRQKKKNYENSNISLCKNYNLECKWSGDTSTRGFSQILARGQKRGKFKNLEFWLCFW